MATPSNSTLPHKAPLIYILLFSLILSSFSASDIHDLLPLYNLPQGLLPREISSYSVSETDNSFTVELSTNPCYVNFNGQTVYFDKIIKGKLKYGKVSDVSGIQAKKLFIWVSVDGIDVDEKNDTLEFHVGVLTKTLPFEDFETVKSCTTKGLRESVSFTESTY